MASDLALSPESANQFAGNLGALELETEYRSLKNDPVSHFYIQCLRNSNLYRRAVGYFRSTVFIVIGPAVIEFARRGGSVKLICSPDLDKDDVEQIASGYASREQMIEKTFVAQFDTLLADPRTYLGARTLATLIATRCLEIKLAERTDRKGIYHEKLGLFSDGTNIVSFKGSANETWSGWHNKGNFESIEVFCSWRGGLEAERVARHERHFEALWSERDPDVEVTPFPKTVADYICRYAAKQIDEIASEMSAPVSNRRSPLPHQSAAIDVWERSGKRGVFEHATGSGKTFTALQAITKHVREGLPALVLVPSTLLLEQWAKEIREEIPDAVLLLAGAGYDRWRQAGRLNGMTSPEKELGPRITLAMMPTAALDDFRTAVSAGEHLMIVADEVHQVGSPRNSIIFQIETGPRLGLSATPKRYGDPDGTARIFDYFGPVLPPPITLQDAVKAGRLVAYEYHPHPINLTATEADDWLTQTRAIQLEVARGKTDSDGKKQLTDRAKMLLIKRARIAKKASAKIKLAVDVVTASYEKGQSWLIYCEDEGQLTDVLIALREQGLTPIEYHSAMKGDREATMAFFREYGGILVSIKCLDEGVDIPAVSHALILASSQNPRQFIQRRGRVLRISANKHLAVIHDAIVVPVNAEKEPEQVSLLKAELVRSIEFARHAINKLAGADLRSIAIRMGIDPDTLGDFEGDEDDE